MKNQLTVKTLLLIGLLATLLSLICDFLLGWLVYPAAAIPGMGMLAGCDQLSFTRLGLSCLFGGVGIPLQAAGFWGIARWVGQSPHPKAATWQKRIRAGAISTATLGGAVHILCVFLMAILHLEIKAGFDVAGASSLAALLPPSALDYSLWGLLPVTLLMMPPYILMAIALFCAIFKGATPMPRWMALCNPFTGMVLAQGLQMLLGNTAFSNAIGMAGMALGGLVPFAGILLWLHAHKIDA